MALTNIAVGEKLDVSHVHISRIRASKGFPSAKMMMDIERWLGWPFTEQSALRWSENKGAYAAEFNRRLDAISIDA